MLSTSSKVNFEGSDYDKEDSFDCVICRRKITRTQFKLIVRKALSRKHNLSLKLFSLQIMNQIINNIPSKVWIDYEEKTQYEIIEENLRKYYKTRYKFKQAVIVHSKTQKPRPKIYIPKYRKVVMKWVYMQENLIRKKEELKARKAKQRILKDYQKLLLPIKNPVEENKQIFGLSGIFQMSSIFEEDNKISHSEVFYLEIISELENDKETLQLLKSKSERKKEIAKKKKLNSLKFTEIKKVRNKMKIEYLTSSKKKKSKFMSEKTKDQTLEVKDVKGSKLFNRERFLKQVSKFNSSRSSLIVTNRTSKNTSPTDSAFRKKRLKGYYTSRNSVFGSKLKKFKRGKIKSMTKKFEISERSLNEKNKTQQKIDSHRNTIDSTKIRKITQKKKRKMDLRISIESMKKSIHSKFSRLNSSRASESKRASILKGKKRSLESGRIKKGNLKMKKKKNDLISKIMKKQRRKMKNVDLKKNKKVFDKKYSLKNSHVLGFTPKYSMRKKFFKSSSPPRNYKHDQKSKISSGKKKRNISSLSGIKDIVGSRKLTNSKMKVKKKLAFVKKKSKQEKPRHKNSMKISDEKPKIKHSKEKSVPITPQCLKIKKSTIDRPKKNFLKKFSVAGNLKAEGRSTKGIRLRASKSRSIGKASTNTLQRFSKTRENSSSINKLKYPKKKNFLQNKFSKTVRGSLVGGVNSSVEKKSKNQDIRNMRMREFSGIKKRQNVSRREFLSGDKNLGSRKVSYTGSSLGKYRSSIGRSNLKNKFSNIKSNYRKRMFGDKIEETQNKMKLKLKDR